MEKLKKNIIIVGGGISGLSLLHYLKIKYYFQEDVKITLLEKEGHLGGTIKTLSRNGCLFETGPNGFLDSKPKTLEFIKELGIENELVRADEQAKIRYISSNNTLYPLPTSPKEFLSFKLLNGLQKLRIVGELISSRGNNPKETVYNFGRRRLGKQFAEIFLDPMVSGVYGGDARKTVLKEAFPKIYELEQEHGSLFKAMFKLKGEKSGMPKGVLTSFNGGMSTVIKTLAERYQAQILLNQEIKTISTHKSQYIIYSGSSQYVADEVFFCAPAYVTATLLENIDQPLVDALRSITYAPMAVVGLVFSKDVFTECPKGFGYLIPSLEKKEILGILFDSNIFPDRCPKDKIIFRIMIGGVKHPDIFKKPKEYLVEMAVKEIKTQFNVTGSFEKSFFTAWHKAIPQYNVEYVESKKCIKARLESLPNLHIVSNYCGGVSFNDCIENAYWSAQ